VATQRHHARAVGVVVLALAVAGCGGGSATRAAWRANARQVVAQLRFDATLADDGGPTRAAAARQLANTSELFGLLLAYTELASCRGMVASTLAPPRIARTLAAPCGHLQRAATLFTQANTNNDPSALVQATHEVGLAEPQLVAASLALKR
jgi:hypothetical protein